MAALHSALQALGPAEYSTIPVDEAQAKDYLRDVFAKTELIVNSVPPPPIEESFVGRPRSNTTSSNASGISDIIASSARSEPTDPSHTALRKEWGKPIKLAAKDNPLGVAVYKLSGKDGKGAWFARSSIHEGLGFKRWKHGFECEFPESLEVQGGPGEGNIRGIGGERRVEDREFGDAGKVQVYQLSAQFPGPTTPRDFVTLLITSSSALSGSDNNKVTCSGRRPRYYMVVSKPCLHPECPARDGFVRGQYESVEFIRELPGKPKKTSSTTDLLRHRAEHTHEGPSAASTEAVTEGRKRGKTISYAEIRGAQAEDPASAELDDESNPIEWIMVTRSDPGGSVPRFMVERGTPAGIVGDAGKFVDWACKRKHPTTATGMENVEGANSEEKDLEAPQTNGHLAGLEPLREEPAPSPSEQQEPAVEASKETTEPQQGLLNNVANATKAGIESYAPQAVIDRMPGSQQSQPPTTEAVAEPWDERDLDEISTTASSMSFASAEEAFGDDLSTKSAPSRTGSMKSLESPQRTRHERELAKVNERKKALDEKFAQRRGKEVKDKEVLTSKEQDRLRKAEEKHKREVEKQEEKYKKEVAKLEAKRAKEASKEEDKKKKEQDKDEKVRLTRERDEARQELAVIKQEKDILVDQVGALQKENTSLVTRLGKGSEGKGSEGKSVLKEVQAEVASETRSRSSSLRSRGTDVGKEATLLAGAKKDEVLES